MLLLLKMKVDKYIDKVYLTVFLNGFKFVLFSLHRKGPRSYREANNLKSIYQHEYIGQE